MLSEDYDEKTCEAMAKAGNKRAVMKITSKGMKKVYEV